MTMFTNKKNLFVIFITTITLFTAALFVFVSYFTPKFLKINEVAFAQEDNVDWIEIFNPSLKNISLKGYYVSDKSNNFTKHRIENEIIIPAHGFGVIYMDRFSEQTATIEKTNFNISLGETIYLIDTDGSTIIDSFVVFTNQRQTKNQTLGRYPDGTDNFYPMPTTSPGGPNYYTNN